MAKKQTDIAETGKPVAANGKGDGEQASEASPEYPMFYNSVSVLNLEEHEKLRIKPRDDYSFAKAANSIVLAAAEFSQAAKHYPIVFGKFGNELLAFAVTGHTGGQNVFVGKDGSWREGAYIPAYVRRYPFILVHSPDKNALQLAVDETSQFVNRKSGDLLYEAGEPSDMAKSALNFCAQFRRELERTGEMLQQIDETGILVEQSAEVALPDGKKSRITGFRVVDERKLSELADEKFLALRKNGALNLIYIHLWSMRYWDNLLG